LAAAATDCHDMHHHPHGTVPAVRDLAAAEIEPTPDFGTTVSTDYILGLAKVKGQVKTLLDIDRVVAPETVQSMVQAT